MSVNNKKNHLFRIIVLLMMLLFAVCAADVLFAVIMIVMNYPINRS